jgi:nitrate/TMAO reductase-like tetraheme cytochrome c subunit
MNPLAMLQGKEKPTGRQLLLAAGLIIVFLLASAWSVAYTSRSEFCGTCHEMDSMYQSWQVSSHQNVTCHECHAEPGVMGEIKAKAKGVKEVYLHVTGTGATPKANERDINCFGCHQEKVKLNTDKAFATKDPHTVKHFNNGMTCITCHSGIVHNTMLNNTVPTRDNCESCHLDAMRKQ